MTQEAGRAAARLVSAGAALVAGSVLADSAMEHYRGSFRNPAMWLPLVSSGLSLGLGGERLAASKSDRLPVVRRASQTTAVIVGAAGLGFHAFNIGARPGGVTLQNLFYGAPVGAPAALIIAGVLGAASDALARNDGKLGPVPLGSGRLLGGFAAAGIVGTVAEAGLLHFRGAFQNPLMYLPVTVPPLAALSLARDSLDGIASPVTTGLLVATATVGIAGVALHAYGVSRRMGGWRNWRQNILAGPPLPAPPAFTGLAAAGLGALLLMRKAAHG